MWTSLEQFWAWASDLNGHYQRMIWSALALAASYFLGAAVSRALRFAARRLAGAHTDPAAGDKAASADHVVLDIVAMFIKAAFVIAAILFVADLYELFDMRQAQGLAITAAKAVGIFVAVWILGSWLARRVRRFGSLVARRDAAAGKTLFAFLGSIVQIAAAAIGAIAALQQFGFPIASLVAVIGAAGLAIALALQDTLKAAAAGVIIAIFRPYRIGDYVRLAGEFGTVTDITPFTTSLNTVDNKRLVITNDRVWGDTMENFSNTGRRRLDEIIGISYDDDIGKAMAIVERIVTADPRARKDPPFWIKVNALNTSSVDLRFRVWCASGDYFDFKCDMLRAIKEAFDEAGVTIPYPHQVEVHKEISVKAQVTSREGDAEQGRA